MKHFADRAPRASVRQTMPVRDLLGLLGIRAFPASIRSLLDELSCWDRLRLVRRLDPATAAALFVHLDTEDKRVIVSHLSVSILARIAAHLPPPERDAVTEALPPVRRARVQKAVQSHRSPPRPTP